MLHQITIIIGVVSVELVFEHFYFAAIASSIECEFMIKQLSHTSSLLHEIFADLDKNEAYTRISVMSTIEF